MQAIRPTHSPPRNSAAIAHNVSRLDRGDTNDTWPKCSAAIGTVSTDAPNVADRVAVKNRGTPWASRSIRLLMGLSK